MLWAISRKRLWRMSEININSKWNTEIKWCLNWNCLLVCRKQTVLFFFLKCASGAFLSCSKPTELWHSHWRNDKWSLKVGNRRINLLHISKFSDLNKQTKKKRSACIYNNFTNIALECANASFDIFFSADSFSRDHPQHKLWFFLYALQVI